MKISLVTVTFNSYRTLRDTIQSVLSQTYPDIEYIIVDGCSQDKTIDIIKEYEPLFHGQLKWISEKDKGLYDAMNKGIRMATGDIIGIINSDDFYHRKDTVMKVSEAFKNDDIQAVYVDVRFVNPQNFIIHSWSKRLYLQQRFYLTYNKREWCTEFMRNIGEEP